jgi:ankyrin repeat protein
VGNLQQLISEGYKDVNVQDELGNTALHWSASADHLDAVQYLVETLKLDVNAVNKVGDTALHKAAWRGSLDCVKYLIDKDANLNALNKDKKRPVDLAHHLEVKSYLQSFEGSDDDEGELEDEDAPSSDEDN